ncbi:hypothetical protein ACHAWF_013481 [Thalassiosira exigua]
MAPNTASSSEPVAAEVDPSIYGKSGDLTKHMEGVKAQYDTADKLEFYAQVMGDGTANIHFGKWDGIDLEEDGAYGKASERMTDYMFDLATSSIGEKDEISYVDLGSGTGAAALRLCANHASIKKAVCLNLCDEQNALARTRAAEANLSERVDVVTGTYEACPLEDAQFDVAFSQDAFVHAFSKLVAFQEAHRVVKPGGTFVFCDLMCGDGPDVSDEELATFANSNMVNDWLSPQQNVEACEKAGWTDVTFADLTGDIKLSFQMMLKKVERILGEGNPKGIDEKLLDSYKKNLAERIGQVDRGVFKWGVVRATKPAE